MINDQHKQLASDIGKALRSKGQTISIAESTTGGLISAALLSVDGASAFYAGGSVVYTRASRKAFLDIEKGKLEGLKPLTEEMVSVFAEAAREKLDATWGVAELGASGPSDSPYGHAAGSSVFAVSGPSNAAASIQTASNNRQTNMADFTTAVLSLVLETIQ